MTGSFLFSYHYFRTTDFDRLFRGHGRPGAVFADSGAFSAHTQGAKVDLEAYADWCEERASFFDVFCNLDVIYDEEQSHRNFERLRDRGIPVMPVFHAGSKWAELERLCEEHDYVALGGVALHGSRRDSLMRWFDRCFDIGHARGCEFHGLGVTSWWALTRYPWLTVDSTSWLQGPKFGSVVWIDPERPDKGFHKVPMYSEEVRKAARAIRAYGRDPAEFMSREAYSKRAAIAVSALSWFEIQRWISQLPHNKGRKMPDAGERPDPWGNRAESPRIYLGVSSTDAIYAVDALSSYAPANASQE